MMMLKKLCLLFGIIFITAGCVSNNFDSNTGDFDDNINSVKEVSKKEINCITDDSEFKLFLENGQIVKYVDSIDGELNSEIVSILNEEHLIGVTDNDTALTIMSAALSDLGGRCD